jgi:hypothetical protein
MRCMKVGMVWNDCHICGQLLLQKSVRDFVVGLAVRVKLFGTLRYMA